MKSAVKTYGFVNAKLRTRLSRLLPDDFWERVKNSPSLTEAIQLFRDTPYDTIVDTYEKSGDLKSVESVLWRREIETVKELAPFLDAKSRRFHTALLLRYEADQIRNLIRLWFDSRVKKRSISGEEGYLYQEPIVHNYSLTAVLNAAAFPELTEALAGTPYRDFLIRREQEIMQDQRLFGFETDLDLYAYRNLSEATGKLGRRDRAIADRIVAIEIDLRNLDRIVRFAYLYPPGQRNLWQSIIPGGSFSQDILRRAAEAEKGEQALQILMSGSYREYASFLESGGGRYTQLGNIEKMLREIRKSETLKLLNGYPFTIGIVLAYVFLRRKEIGAIVSLLNKKYYG